MQIKDALSKVLPWIGAAAAGNVPGLIALAAQTVGDALGTKVAPTTFDIQRAVAGATPEQMVTLQAGENDFKLKMQEAGYKDAEDLRHAEIELTKTLAADTESARVHFAADKGVYRLGIVILATFALVTAGSMYGAFKLLTDNDLKSVDVGIVAAVFGFLGTILGYVAANAQQVVSYFFGSSRGSADRGRDMADAFKGLAKNGN